MVGKAWVMCWIIHVEKSEDQLKFMYISAPPVVLGEIDHDAVVAWFLS